MRRRIDARAHYYMMRSFARMTIESMHSEDPLLAPTPHGRR